MSIIMKRKSIREYTNETISKEHITELLKAAMQAPSARNQQPWEFIVVDNKELLQTLSSASKGAWMLKDAALCIIPCIKPTDKSPHFAQQDLAAATQNILLRATELHLGAVWIGVYPLEERVNHIRKTLGMTGEINPFSMIAIGHRNEEPSIKKRYDESRVHYNNWNK